MTKWLDPMNTAVALRDKLAEGDLEWIRARFADGDLNFLRDRLAAGDRAVFARHLATGDLPWIRTVLSNVTIPDVGPLAGPGSTPSTPVIAAGAPTERIAAEQPSFSHSASGVAGFSAQGAPGIPHLPPPPVGATPIPIGGGTAGQWAATAAVPPVAARVDTPPAPTVNIAPTPAPQPVIQPTSQMTQTTTNFEVSDGAQQTLDLGRPRRRWPWLLLIPALLIGGIAFANSRSKSKTSTTATTSASAAPSATTATTVALATTKAAAPASTTVAPAATTVAPATTRAAPATTVAPAATTLAPVTTKVAAVTTVAPAPTTVAPAPTTKAPAPTTAAPPPTTPAPTTTAAPAAPAGGVLATIVFNDSSSDLTGEAYAALAKLAGDLKAKGVPATIVVTAYSDAQPSPRGNVLYMDERNENVVKELQRLGINTNYKRVRGGVATRRVDISAGA
jgi:outer membrane protein OmpA-like peptidoglycan-associated protein